MGRSSPATVGAKQLRVRAAWSRRVVGGRERKHRRRTHTDDTGAWSLNLRERLVASQRPPACHRKHFAGADCAPVRTVGRWCARRAYPRPRSGAGGAYSPDGSTIAYFDSGNLKLLNLTTGTRKTLAPPYYPLQGALAWAPNGRTIAYSEGDTGFIPIVLHATPVNGSPGRVMGLLPGGFETPLWARSLLVWLPHGGGKPASGIAVGNPTTGRTRVLQPLRALSASQIFVAGPVSVLPGGTRIVYDVISPFPHPNNDLGLRTVSVNGRGDAPLVACRGRGHGDLVIGTPANDVINVRNGSIDTVTCLGGVDTVIADRQDKIGRSCEIVHRS